MERATSASHLRAVDGGGRTPDPSEAELVRRAAGGDGGAWTRLYQDNFQRLYSDLLHHVYDRATAEELCQEAFAAALLALPRFDGRVAFRTWLRGVAQNLVRKHWRSLERRGRAFRKLEADVRDERPTDPEQHHMRDAQADALAAVLEELPTAQREVFILRDVQGVPVDEVAQILSLSPGNVRVRANRARAKIREGLQRLGWLGSTS